MKLRLHSLNIIEGKILALALILFQIYSLKFYNELILFRIDLI